MKTCPHCNIKVGGHTNECPLCQNQLIGEGIDNLWPDPLSYKGQSILYSIQLFVALSGTAVSLCIDFLLGKHGNLHWSLQVLLWVIICEALLKRFSNNHHNKSGVLTISMMIIAIAMLVTAHFAGFWDPVMRVMVPVFIIIALVVNFIMALMDTSGNALSYLLSSIATTLIAYLVFFLQKKDISLAWTICLMVGLVTLIGVCVFMGRRVILEIQKRTSI